MNVFKKMKLKTMLKNCDYKLAGTVIKQQYYQKNSQSEINRLIDDFLANPGFDQAVRLIEYNEMMIFYFTESRTGGLYVGRSGDGARLPERGESGASDEPAGRGGRAKHSRRGGAEAAAGGLPEGGAQKAGDADGSLDRAPLPAAGAEAGISGKSAAAGPRAAARASRPDSGRDPSRRLSAGTRTGSVLDAGADASQLSSSLASPERKQAGGSVSSASHAQAGTASSPGPKAAASLQLTDAVRREPDGDAAIARPSASSGRPAYSVAPDEAMPDEAMPDEAVKAAGAVTPGMTAEPAPPPLSRRAAHAQSAEAGGHSAAELLHAKRQEAQDAAKNAGAANLRPSSEKDGPKMRELRTTIAGLFDEAEQLLKKSGKNFADWRRSNAAEQTNPVRSASSEAAAALDEAARPAPTPAPRNERTARGAVRPAASAGRPGAGKPSKDLARASASTVPAADRHSGSSAATAGNRTAASDAAAAEPAERDIPGTLPGRIIHDPDFDLQRVKPDLTLFPNVIKTLKIDIQEMNRQLREYRMYVDNAHPDSAHYAQLARSFESAMTEFTLAVEFLNEFRR